jgi:Kef-type K+ transport system membrane component KefB
VLAAVLPEEAFTVLRAVGHVGLVLFLVGVAHKLRGAPAVSRGRAVVCVATGALLVPLATGVVFAAWVVHTGEPAMRGDAPTAALTLFIAVSLSVTAVPVLARILADRGLMDRELGRLAMTTAVIVDAVAWLLLALAIGLAAGAAGGVLRRLGILAFAVLGTLLVFRLLRWRPATRLCVRFPRVTAALIAVVALLAADGLRRWGLTEILGALAVGYAIPPGVQSGQWDRAVNLVARIGRWLVPVSSCQPVSPCSRGSSRRCPGRPS